MFVTDFAGGQEFVVQFLCKLVEFRAVTLSDLHVLGAFDTELLALLGKRIGLRCESFAAEKQFGEFQFGSENA